jgi:tricorn protease
LPWANGSFAGLYGVENGVVALYNGTVAKFDMGSRTASTILGTQVPLAFNAKRTKLAYLAGGTLGISDVRPGVEVGTGRVNTSGASYMWDPVSEWRQMYWEAWRYQRDNFYDEDMLGLDWKAIGDKYAALLPYVSHRSDLNYLLGLMIGELGTGHAYVQGAGDTGFAPSGAMAATLGADYATEGGKVKFQQIYRGLNFEPARRGPLGAPGVDVHDGDYLLQINGTDVTSTTGVGELLLDKANQTVTLTVNDKPSMDGARTVKVRPIASEGELRYISWVEANRARVHRESNGRIGYMHVPNTAFEGIIEFTKGFYSNSAAEAWIIDERYNGGGFIPTFFIEALQRQMATAFAPRYGQDIALPPQAWEGPKCMLINEFAGSGGDMLPWLFKNAGLGKLIGTRTWGGLVGIQGAAGLVDGGGVTAPAFGIYDRATRKWIAENTGIDPDIEVDARPDLVAAGKDPVLDRALAEMTKAIGPTPRKPIAKPAFPSPKGGG